MMCTRPLAILTAMAWLMSSVATTYAQGLLWSLPEDGSIAEYVGKYKNKQERPGSNEGPLELEWDSKLTIQSVGEETADYNGQPTPCRWIEFKMVIGKPSTKGVEGDAGIDPGPHGTRIYKVLIPVDRVKGELKDAQGLPITYIPIVKGYRKIGQQPAQPVREKVLAFYPMLGLFANYLDLTAEGEAADLELPNFGTVKATLNKGTLKLQNKTSKSENVGEIWRSDEVPFGWAKYHVKLTRQEKDITEADDKFVPAAEIEVEMAIVKKEMTGAKSEIGEVSDEPAMETPAAAEATEKPAAEATEKPAAEATEKPATEATEKPAAEAAPEKSEM